MFKKYYIESKIRFTIFITLMIMIIGLSLNAVLNLSKAYADGKGTDIKTYYAITVESGDTLWSIAQNYVGSKTDIREFIYEIKTLNDLDSSDIQIGQELLIPA